MAERYVSTEDKKNISRNTKIGNHEQQVQSLGGEKAVLASLQEQIGNRTVQRLLEQKSGSISFELEEDTTKPINHERTNGQVLNSNIQAGMKEATGQDFSNVRAHTGPVAHVLQEHLGAKAFTTGSDIFFQKGAYGLDSSDGQELLAHEPTHVVQQRSGAVGGSSGKITVYPPGNRFEQGTDNVAKEVVSFIHNPQVQRQVPKEEGKKVQINTLQLQAEESEKEELEREEEEINCGLQKQSAGDTPKGLFEEKDIASAKRWYEARRNQYPEDIIRLIQEKVDANVDGKIGRQTIKAIAKWQSCNDQLVDGKAGRRTIIKMFRKDIRPGLGKVIEITEDSESGKSEIPRWIYDLFQILAFFGFTNKRITPFFSEQKPRKSPEEGKKPASRSSGYHILKGKGYFESLDKVAIKPSLLVKMYKLAQYALKNDLVKSNITLNSGMRSPKKAHLWSTAFHIRKGVVPMKVLQVLPEGKDKDGNVWYKQGWTMKEAQQNAYKAWKGDFAAEGYPTGDERRVPNTYKGGVTRHATGLAIDATFVWKVNSDKDGNSSASLEKLRETIKHRFAKTPKRLSEILSKIDRFVARGSYGTIAGKTINRFGLKRPALHSTSNAEDWHYEEK